MTTTLLTHRLVRLAIAAVTLAVAATTAVNAQQGATYEVVSSFDLPFRAGERRRHCVRPATVRSTARRLPAACSIEERCFGWT